MPDLDDPEELFSLTIGHLNRVLNDPNATWQDRERALELGLMAALLPPATTDPPSQGQATRATQDGGG